MSDEVQQSMPPEWTSGEVPTSPRVSLDKRAADPAPGGSRDAASAPAPASAQDAGQVEDAVPAAGGPYAPVRDGIPAARQDPAPAPGSVHDQQTLTSLPAAPAVPAQAVPAPWVSPADSVAPPANPFAPPAASPAVNPYAPPAAPVNPYAPPTAPAAAGSPFTPPAPAARHGQAEPVPPPPIAPDGPGQVPYGYPGGPSAYGYPGQPQPPYGGPYPAPNGYGWPGMQPAPSDGMGTASLVLGILASIGFLLWPVALVLGVLAIIFGAIGRGKANRGEATNPGVALAGLICGTAGVVLALGLVAFLIAFNT